MVEHEAAGVACRSPSLVKNPSLCSLSVLLKSPHLGKLESFGCVLERSPLCKYVGGTREIPIISSLMGVFSRFSSLL